VANFRFGDDFLLAATFLASPDHNRRAVCIVGTEENAIVPAEFLKTHPNICLDVLDQMPDVDRTIGVREGGGNEDAALGHDGKTTSKA
jgi:hypothetical protein